VLLGLCAGAASAALLAPSCSLSTDPHSGTSGYDLGSDYFAEMAAPELPATGCMPMVPTITFFDSAVQDAIKNLGCTMASPCHGGGAAGLTLDPANASANYQLIVMLGLLGACTEDAKILTQPTDMYHKGVKDFASMPDFTTLKNWVLSCAPLSMAMPEPGCRGGGQTDGGGSDAAATDTPAPTPDAGGTCNTMNLSYTTDIDPIVTSLCIGCHGGPPVTLVAGNPEANYQQLGGQTGIQNRKYIYGLPDSSMPHPFQNVITPGSCQDSEVRAWIQAGANP
jgi:hypothetical protein